MNRQYGTGRSPRILIVDDEEHVCELLGTWLSDVADNCDYAHSVDEALELVAAGSHEVVITDLRMPGGSGFDIVRTVRERDPETAVIIMTGYGSMETAIEAMRLGAFDYVTKPFNLDEVRLTVERALESHRLRARNRQLASLVEGTAGAVASVSTTLARFVRLLQDHGGYKIGHSERVRSAVARLAAAMGVGAEEQVRWEAAASLCEIGEVAIPVRIWLKRGPLSQEDWFYVRKHPEKGESFLRDAGLEGEVTRAVRGHHEQWDGGGYPDGREKETIPPASRAIAIAAACDAMTTHRPYREAIVSQAAAQELLREAGKQFDPEMVRVYVDKVIRGE